MLLFEDINFYSSIGVNILGACSGGWIGATLSCGDFGMNLLETWWLQAVGIDKEDLTRDRSHFDEPSNQVDVRLAASWTAKPTMPAPFPPWRYALREIIASKGGARRSRHDRMTVEIHNAYQMYRLKLVYNSLTQYQSSSKGFNACRRAMH